MKEDHEQPARPKKQSQHAHLPRYALFYWPLVLTSISASLVNLSLSAFLARSAEGVVELAAFAIAASLLTINNAAMTWFPQLVNVFARSRHATRLCFRFTLAICLALTVPLAAIAFLPAGARVLAAVYAMEPEVQQSVILYLRTVTPAVVLTGFMHFWNGMLIQCGRTILVTILQTVKLTTVVLALLASGWFDLPAIQIAGLAQVLPLLLNSMLGGLLVYRFYRRPELPVSNEPTYREMFAFYWPTALTSLLFSINRPIIFAFASRVPDPLPLMAALRVTFDLNTMFVNPMNQFRHVYVTFGERDLRGVRRFMLRVSAGITLLMLAVVVTPLSGFLFGTLLGLPAAVKQLAVGAFAVFCLMPAAAAVRNDYHGRALVARTTGRMGVGSLLRLAAVFGFCYLLQETGYLNQFTAPALIVAGFLVETLAMIWIGRRSRK